MIFTKKTKIGIGDLNKDNLETAVFGAGCFWCVEAIFLRINGVEGVISGYCGGFSENPDYNSVCSGSTGHAEVCKISFDPEITTYKDLLKVFFETHDPTTLNSQGADVGTQYRSAIFYLNKEQKRISEKVIETLNKKKIFKNPIVTKLEPLNDFYKAEAYHQNYYELNKNQPYCQIVIKKKLDSFF